MLNIVITYSFNCKSEWDVMILLSVTEAIYEYWELYDGCEWVDYTLLYWFTLITQWTLDKRHLCQLYFLWHLVFLDENKKMWKQKMCLVKRNPNSHGQTNVLVMWRQTAKHTCDPLWVLTHHSINCALSADLITLIPIFKGCHHTFALLTNLLHRL